MGETSTCTSFVLCLSFFVSVSRTVYHCVFHKRSKAKRKYKRGHTSTQLPSELYSHSFQKENLGKKEKEKIKCRELFLFWCFKNVTIAVKALFQCQNVAETVSAYQNVPAVMVNRGLLPISEISHCEPPGSRPAGHHLQRCNVKFQKNWNSFWGPLVDLSAATSLVGHDLAPVQETRSESLDEMQRDSTSRH